MTSFLQSFSCTFDGSSGAWNSGQKPKISPRIVLNHEELEKSREVAQREPALLLVWHQSLLLLGDNGFSRLRHLVLLSIQRFSGNRRPSTQLDQESWYKVRVWVSDVHLSWNYVGYTCVHQTNEQVVEN